ncbi:hypothetical protein [Rhodoplanes sp. Z2-YC6860]|uniref:hypothetical protein n=1 Tax=Rhodoplanes sp. Z2-YC6860 TaxID=674703 RepID=UPI000A0634BC|nr:hypothetical protein [Rhodoplanes sp. Z2-YC6860]
MRALKSTVIAMAAVVTPALAADGYYIVRDPVARRCTVVNQRPTLSTTVIVGGTVYKTREEAEKAMMSAGACSEE